MTFFDVLQFFLTLLGLALGGGFVGKHFGLGWAIAAAVAGALAGCAIGAAIKVYGFRWVLRDVQRTSTDELRRQLREGCAPSPQLALLVLSSRGEDIQPELPRVLDMLESPTSAHRRAGWIALRWAFSDLADKIPDYRPEDSPDICRSKLDPIR